MAQISNFTKSGKRVSGVRAAGLATSPLGRLDPLTGKVWQHPRLVLNRIAGSRVTVTNPRALAHVQAQRTASIGANAAGQRKRDNAGA